MIVVCTFLFVFSHASRFDTITLRIAIVSPIKGKRNFLPSFIKLFLAYFESGLEQSWFAWNHRRFNRFKISVAGDANQKHLKCSTGRNVTIRIMRKSFSIQRNFDRNIYAERCRNISWKFPCRCIITCRWNKRYCKIAFSCLPRRNCISEWRTRRSTESLMIQ